MKGTEVTQEQLDAADRFLTRTERGRAKVSEGIVNRDDIVRLLAWYAAIRLEAIGQGGAGDDGQPTGEPL